MPPVGDHGESQSEPHPRVDGVGGVRGEVEGGRERWEEEGKRRSGRRKRKVDTNVIEYGMQEQQQMYGVSERDCVAQPLQQQQQHMEHSNHSSHIKRSSMDTETSFTDQQQGHYLEMGAACITEAGMDNPHYPHSQSGEAFIGEVEDLVCVTRREQAKVHELLVQCEEALSEGMAYETFFPVRIDEMLRATHSLEQSLLEQKQAMKHRLQEILGIL